MNDTLTEVADGLLRDLGHQVKIVRADSDYDIKEEVQNFVWADVVIWQMPGWWMGAPWTVKNIWMMSLPKVTVRSMPAMAARVPMPLKVRFRRSGAGEKIYAVTDVERADGSIYRKDQFFHGVGVDGVYLPFHKANQFTGMDALPTFIANDVIKMPDVPRYTAEYRKHLSEILLNWSSRN